MPLATRLRSDLLEARVAARMLRHLPLVLPGVRAGATVLMEKHIATIPDRPAIWFEDERYTWGEFDARANAYARFFTARGVGPGDTVALLMDNRPEYLFTIMGLSKIGAVCACVNTHATGSALAHAVRLGKPRFLLAGTEHAAAASKALSENADSPLSVVVISDRGEAPDVETVDAEIAAQSTAPVPRFVPKNTDPAMYLYTSGTTGLPKAAIVTGQRFLLAAFAFGEIFMEATPEDVVYVCLPLYHGTAQWGGLGGILATGASIALRRKFSASNFWPDVVRFGATRALYIGELCRYLLLQPPSPADRSHGIRVMTGNGLRRDVWTPFQERFGIPLIREFYGATEGNAPLANIEGRPGMVGRLPGGQALLACDPETGAVRRNARGRCVRVETPGETGLLVGRITLFRRFDGYLDQRATESKVLRDVFRRGDAWFNTGDLMTLHEDDWLSFADRVGDTFRWKGENVSTNEVSLALNRAPGVLDSNVFGVKVPNAEGRAGMACLRVSESFDLDAFRQHVDSVLPSYARPLFLRIERELRTTSTFKHQKVDYVAEGYDPAKVEEPLHVRLDDRYVPVDSDVYARIQRSEVVPGSRRAID